jgi:putative membrane protein
MYLYLKALHIIFVVTWFAGLFYMPRLFIYNTEANEQNENERKILQTQFTIMIKRLWYGITWPSAIITLLFGVTVLFNGNWNASLFTTEGRWLLIQLIFVLFLYLYHYSLQIIVNQEIKGVFKYSSQQLRMYNEVATVFLFAIIFLAVVKESISFVWGLIGIIIFIAVLMIAINIYKKSRNKKQ